MSVRAVFVFGWASV